MNSARATFEGSPVSSSASAYTSRGRSSSGADSTAGSNSSGVATAFRPSNYRVYYRPAERGHFDDSDPAFVPRPDPAGLSAAAEGGRQAGWSRPPHRPAADRSGRKG